MKIIRLALFSLFAFGLTQGAVAMSHDASDNMPDQVQGMKESVMDTGEKKDRSCDCNNKGDEPNVLSPEQTETNQPEMPQ